MASRKFRPGVLLIAHMALAVSVSLAAQAAWAANGCDAQHGGIGGTGDLARERGIGGTGSAARGSGIGGTGAPTPGAGIGGTGSAARGGGIGGTGDLARDSGTGGTGIVGIITGFASICVNGMEVHYDENTPMEINGRRATAKDLAVGQLVRAEAVGKGDEVVARNISIQYAVAGPVARVGAGGGQVSILGQTVQVTEHTIKPAGANNASLRPGDFVQVSGLRKQDGVIVAARIDRAADQKEVSVSGPVSRVSAHEFSVSGLRVSSATGNMPQGMAAGREVRVSGQLHDGVLHAEKIDVASAVPFGGREQRLELQGYVHASRTADRLTVGQAQLEISPQTVIGGKLGPDQLVRVSAHFTPDKRLVAERVEVARDYFERRERHGANRESAGQSARHAERKESDERRAGEKTESGEREHRVTPKGGERPEKPEGSSRSERHREETHRHEPMERAERVERTERTEHVELPERVERIERVELPEKIEIPERVERVERVEIPEKIELPER